MKKLEESRVGTGSSLYLLVGVKHAVSSALVMWVIKTWSKASTVAQVSVPSWLFYVSCIICHFVSQDLRAVAFSMAEFVPLTESYEGL